MVYDLGSSMEENVSQLEQDYYAQWVESYKEKEDGKQPLMFIPLGKTKIKKHESTWSFRVNIFIDDF